MDSSPVNPRNFEVQVGDIIWKRHQEQLRPRFIPSTLGSELVCAPQLPEQTEGLDSVADALSSPQDSSVRDSELPASAPEQPERRYPLRERKPPQRYY